MISNLRTDGAEIAQELKKNDVKQSLLDLVGSVLT